MLKHIVTKSVLKSNINVQWSASFRWSFGPNSAWGSIEMATILKTHPTSPERIINKVGKNRHEIGLDLSKFYKQFIEAIFFQLFVDYVNQ